MSLRLRSFFFSFLPMCLALAASFFAISAGFKGVLKERLKGSMYKIDAIVQEQETRYQQRNGELAGILSESAALKAAIALSVEALPSTATKEAVRRTIEQTLSELGAKLDYDFLAVADVHGIPIAAITRDPKQRFGADAMPAIGLGPHLMHIGANIYDTAAVPITINGDALGELAVGRRFKLVSGIAELGESVLTSEGRVLLTTFDSRLIPSLETVLASLNRADLSNGVETNLNGTSHLILPVKRASLGGEFQLFSFRSVDQAVREYTARLRGTLLIVAAGGVLLVLLLAIFGSNSTVRPLAELLATLRESEKTGRLRADFRVQSSVHEVNQLAQAFNRAATAINDSQNRLDRAYLEFTQTMAQALDARDPYTAGHSSRVSAYSANIAVELGLTPEQVQIVRTGAQLHDIGKIGIPDGILQNPGRLTDQEYDLIRLHPQIGKKILEKVERFKDLLPMLELHHEDFDGGGYPHGLRGAETPLCARIVRVADAYDAMSTNRAYRAALDPESIMNELITMSYRQFDPAVVAAFISTLMRKGEYAAYNLPKAPAPDSEPVLDLGQLAGIR